MRACSAPPGTIALGGAKGRKLGDAAHRRPAARARAASLCPCGRTRAAAARSASAAARSSSGSRDSARMPAAGECSARRAARRRCAATAPAPGHSEGSRRTARRRRRPTAPPSRAARVMRETRNVGICELSANGSSNHRPAAAPRRGLRGRPRRARCGRCRDAARPPWRRAPRRTPSRGSRWRTCARAGSTAPASARRRSRNRSRRRGTRRAERRRSCAGASHRAAAVELIQPHPPRRIASLRGRPRDLREAPVALDLRHARPAREPASSPAAACARRGRWWRGRHVAVAHEGGRRFGIDAPAPGGMRHQRLQLGAEQQMTVDRAQ